MTPRARKGALAAAAALVVAGLATLAIAGCGDNPGRDTSTGSSTVTIWTSLPLQGPAREVSESIVNAQRLALEEAGGRVGEFTVKLNVRDDATADAGGWDLDQTSGNARRAVQDKSTIAYIGELDWEATAISIPILNEVGTLQLSPASTYSGLTQPTEKGEPEKYYPSGERTFGRVLPNDLVQARALVADQVQARCGSLFVISARAVDRAALAREIARLAPRDGIEVQGFDEADPNGSGYIKFAQDIAATGADCVFVPWTGSDNDIALLTALTSAGPELLLFAPAMPTAAAFVARLSPDLTRNLRITSPALEESRYPAAARRFFVAYRNAFGREPDPYAIFGYETVKVLLQAIADAGAKGNDRTEVIKAFFRIRDRQSVLGRYSITASGDTTLARYGAYRVEDGLMVLAHVYDLAPEATGG